ncbi:hypothetical protein [Kribbella deserti]|uniref:Uncharacterized protein n=1 Tax=Kribbella deserti TaxID=1926257 RepID=A0ABV6QJ15_9ACTN
MFATATFAFLSGSSLPGAAVCTSGSFAETLKTLPDTGARR